MSQWSKCPQDSSRVQIKVSVFFVFIGPFLVVTLSDTFLVRILILRPTMRGSAESMNSLEQKAVGYY